MSQQVHIVEYGYLSFAFTSLAKAADAVKFFNALQPVEWKHEGAEDYYVPEERTMAIKLEANQRFKPRPKRLTLPAPKRGTVACQVCESVSVKPGHACDSCGTVAPLV